MDFRDYIAHFPPALHSVQHEPPWNITSTLIEILETLINGFGDDFNFGNGTAIHRSAVIETGVTLKRPVIVMENSFVGANSYFREGVFLDASTHIGPGCEIKSSIICSETAIAHFNYIGNSIIGRQVNFEAGSVAANHFNERLSGEIIVNHRGKLINTGVKKFGSLVGDHSRIGANAVLSPGTILEKNTIVKRLELIEQVRDSPGEYIH